MRTCGSPRGPLGRTATAGGGFPVTVTGIANARDVEVGLSSVLVRRADNSVWGWGDATSGSLGAAASSRTPVLIREITAVDLDMRVATVGWVAPS